MAINQEKATKFLTNFVNRITSYNVCYTKLLREEFVLPAGEQTKDFANLESP